MNECCKKNQRHGDIQWGRFGDFEVEEAVRNLLLQFLALAFIYRHLLSNQVEG